MTEFNLSEKINRNGDLYVPDVREFIKKLKELGQETHNTAGANDILLLTDRDIDKLAGDKLTGEENDN